MCRGSCGEAAAPAPARRPAAARRSARRPGRRPRPRRARQRRARSTNASAMVSPRISSGPSVDGGANHAGGGGFGGPRSTRPCGQRPELAEVGRHLVAAEAEALLDLQASAPCGRGCRGRAGRASSPAWFSVSQRPAELLREDLGDSSRASPASPSPGQGRPRPSAWETRTCAARRGSGTARRSASQAVRVVPSSSQGLRTSRRSSGSCAVQALHRDVHGAARHEEEQVRQQQAHAVEEVGHERRLLAGVGVAEGTAPDAARAARGRRPRRERPAEYPTRHASRRGLPPRYVPAGRPARGCGSHPGSILSHAGDGLLLPAPCPALARSRSGTSSTLSRRPTG